MSRLAMLPLLLLFITGCGAPRFDGSSKEAAEASMKAMTEGMSDAEKQELGASIAAILFAENLPRAFSGQTLTESQMYSGLQGLTAAEINAKAQQLRDAAAQRRPPGTSPP